MSFWRLAQMNPKYKDCLDYRVSSRPIWMSQWDPVSDIKENENWGHTSVVEQLTSMREVGPGGECWAISTGCQCCKVLHGDAGELKTKNAMTLAKNTSVTFEGAASSGYRMEASKKGCRESGRRWRQYERARLVLLTGLAVLPWLMLNSWAQAILSPQPTD